ncbi:Tim44/TimA family putative adaptor protein [Litorimonas sp. WD9-15]|uniref:Tim44/TimA family putative adaptor protein n=1 Tax=Litorimonas sp. WD9-15 TaxID=3418716 RepID=UPI003CFBF1DE
MFDVMIYAALATIVCVVFYSVLGKQTGFGGTPDEKVDPVAFGMEDVNKKPEPEAGPDPEIERLGLSAITRLDPSFSIANFMNGATAAYSMILEAYAGGDRDMLKDLLTPETFEIYDEAITAREKAGQTQVTDLGRLRKASIKSARTEGSVAHIRVLYEADLTSALRDSGGNVVQGDPDVLSSVSEVWEYERDLKGKDLNWRLAEVEPSEGDDMKADPSPDTTV